MTNESNLPPEPWTARDNMQGFIQIRDADDHYVACVRKRHPQRDALAALIIAAPGSARRLAEADARAERAEAALNTLIGEILATAREFDGVASAAARFNHCLRLAEKARAALAPEAD